MNEESKLRAHYRLLVQKADELSSIINAFDARQENKKEIQDATQQKGDSQL